MYAKVVILMTGLVATYVLLIFAASTWWQAVPLAIFLGLALAGIGFNLGLCSIPGQEQLLLP
jgi:linoleoyl-CoA desaturase